MEWTFRSSTEPPIPPARPNVIREPISGIARSLLHLNGRGSSCAWQPLADEDLGELPLIRGALLALGLETTRTCSDVSLTCYENAATRSPPPGRVPS